MADMKTAEMSPSPPLSSQWPKGRKLGVAARSVLEGSQSGLAVRRLGDGGRLGCGSGGFRRLVAGGITPLGCTELTTAALAATRPAATPRRTLVVASGEPAAVRRPRTRTSRLPACVRPPIAMRDRPARMLRD